MRARSAFIKRQCGRANWNTQPIGRGQTGFPVSETRGYGGDTGLRGRHGATGETTGLLWRHGATKATPDSFLPAFSGGYDSGMSGQPSFPATRPSTSHAASRKAEIDRVRRLTVEERIKAALGMAGRFAGLQPAPRKE